MAVKQTKEPPTEKIYRFWAWQLLIWALYRYFIHWPEWADEFIVKPLVFVLPVFWYVLKREKRNLTSIGLTCVNFRWSLLASLGISAVFLGEGAYAHLFKYGTWTITPLPSAVSYGVPMLIVLSLATAFCEELLSRGFFFSRLYEITKRFWYAAIMSTCMFVAFHIPILVTSLRFTGMTLMIFLLTNILIGIVNSFLFAHTKSLVAPIAVHLFWNVTVALFL